MIYIIASNIGLAFMMIIIYVRYSHFRISSTTEIRDLRKKLDKEAEFRKSIEGNLESTTKGSSQKAESLLREIGGLRKEKESEVKLRLEAEKQIELALQKTDEVQKRMKDWSIVQDAVMKDYKESIVKLGNELFKKMNDSYKVEVETNRNLIGRISQTVAELMEKNFSTSKKSAEKSKEEGYVLEQDGERQENDIVKILVADLHNTMKANGHFVNKDYFLPSNFDKIKAKLLLCEVAYVAEEKLYIIDFKACRYLAEYKNLSATNKPEADAILKQKLDKYVAYLSNKKYRDSILKVLSTTTAKFSGEIMIVGMSSQEDMKILKEFRYYEQLRKLDFEVMDFDEVNNLVL